MAAYEELSYGFDKYADPQLGTGEEFRFLIEKSLEESSFVDVVYDPVVCIGRKAIS